MLAISKHISASFYTHALIGNYKMSTNQLLRSIQGLPVLKPEIKTAGKPLNPTEMEQRHRIWPKYEPSSGKNPEQAS